MKKMNKLSIILLIATMMATQLSIVNAADAPIIQVTADDIHLTAGELNSVTVKLKNTGDYNVYDVEAYLSSSVPGITVLSGQQMIFNTIGDGNTRSYSPELYLDENLPVGVYTLSLYVIYGRTGASLQSTATVPIGVVVDQSYVPKVRFTPSQDRSVKSGTENDVVFTFANNWNQDVSNLSLTLSSSTNTITISDGINSQVGALAVGASVDITPAISITEGIALGTYTITASASYKDSAGTRYYQTYQLPLNIDSAAAVRNTIITIESMDVLQESIQPGDIFTISLTIKCSGADSYNLLSSINFAPTSMISPVSPTIISLGDLEAGNTVVTTYRLLASGDISAGQYSVPSTITYTNSKGLPGTLTESFTLLVDGLIEFDLLDTPTEMVSAGEISELEADLLLIGTESVQFVSIGVVEDGVIERVSGSDEYIGAVDPDSPIPFDIKYKVKEGVQQGTYDLKLSVQYRDHLNKEHSEILELGIDVGETIDGPPQSENGGIWTWIRILLGLGP
jgi:hypothetical protein